jgi:hypothetical protein
MNLPTATFFPDVIADSYIFIVGIKSIFIYSSFSMIQLCKKEISKFEKNIKKRKTSVIDHNINANYDLL